MQRATLACVAAALALLAAAPLAAALLSQPANEGIPPGFAGLWAEEREGVDGGPSMLLSRQWLPDGNGFVMYTQISDNGTLVKGAFVRDRFLGWECAGKGGVVHFFTRTTDYDAEGQFVRERELCLAGVLQGGQLTYNYTLAEDGCPGPDEYDRWTARSVPTTLLPGVEGDSVDSCP
ncbi:hypothetical protein COHA_002862 [Chlorella ohadii]|uniref:Uncharacterized protein n=1 Tax=Chlorella ohadii TaxID=2649997 RepID=A0AAD5H8H1_9CHLO|nr:hypothetical protein COHA_002862 [Chlorella ohadii]